MFVTISIQPFGAGWTVQVDGVSNDMVYRNGTDAETAARSLGEMLVGQGKPVEIHLYLRDGGLASRLICTPGGGDTWAAWEPRSKGQH